MIIPARLARNAESWTTCRSAAARWASPETRMSTANRKSGPSAGRTVTVRTHLPVWTTNVRFHVRLYNRAPSHPSVVFCRHIRYVPWYACARAGTLAAAAVLAGLPSRSWRLSAPKTTIVPQSGPAWTRSAGILVRADPTQFAMSSITSRYVRARWDTTEIRMFFVQEVSFLEEAISPRLRHVNETCERAGSCDILWSYINFCVITLYFDI